MTRVYIADSKPEELSAIRLLLLDLKMEVVGDIGRLGFTSHLAYCGS
jgi:hypothetical protein